MKLKSDYFSHFFAKVTNSCTLYYKMYSDSQFREFKCYFFDHESH